MAEVFTVWVCPTCRQVDGGPFKHRCHGFASPLRTAIATRVVHESALTEAIESVEAFRRSYVVCGGQLDELRAKVRRAKAVLDG